MVMATDARDSWRPFPSRLHKGLQIRFVASGPSAMTDLPTSKFLCMRSASCTPYLVCGHLLPCIGGGGSRWQTRPSRAVHPLFEQAWCTNNAARTQLMSLALLAEADNPPAGAPESQRTAKRLMHIDHDEDAEATASRAPFVPSDFALRPPGAEHKARIWREQVFRVECGPTMRKIYQQWLPLSCAIGAPSIAKEPHCGNGDIRRKTALTDKRCRCTLRHAC